MFDTGELQKIMGKMYSSGKIERVNRSYSGMELKRPAKPLKKPTEKKSQERERKDDGSEIVTISEKEERKKRENIPKKKLSKKTDARKDENHSSTEQGDIVDVSI